MNTQTAQVASGDLARPRSAAQFAQRYGTWAVVTGASTGIGAALARGVAARGVNTLLVARREDLLEKLSNELSSSFGIESRTLALDLATHDSTYQLIAATTDLDVGLLIAAAGFGTSGNFLTSDIETELEMISVNCSAVCAHTYYFGRRFSERGRGGIVLLSSIVGFQGMPFAANYAATKAYVQSLGEGLSRELRPAGVDVLTVAPGPTASGFADRAGMKMNGADTPAQLVNPILNSLGKRATLLPSIRSKVLRRGVLTMPSRSGRVWIMGNIMKSMTKHDA